jgi:tRNA pseudouridine55 synthase
VGLGRATRLLEYLVGHDKEYRATIRLGEARDTLDREGRLLETRSVPPLGRGELEAVLARVRGVLEQVPPAHSAIKVNGAPLYRAARRGEAVEVPPRRVEIRRLEMLSWEPPDLTVAVECSKGTYVRSLARDLGEALGTGGTLWELVRLRSGRFTLAESVPLAVLGTEGEAAAARVLPPEEMVRDLPRVSLGAEALRALSEGRPVEAGVSPEGDVAAFGADGRLYAVVRKTEEGLRPVKVFRGPEHPGFTPRELVC